MANGLMLWLMQHSRTHSGIGRSGRGNTRKSPAASVATPKKRQERLSHSGMASRPCLPLPVGRAAWVKRKNPEDVAADFSSTRLSPKPGSNRHLRRPWGGWSNADEAGV